MSQAILGQLSMAITVPFYIVLVFLNYNMHYESMVTNQEYNETNYFQISHAMDTL